MNEASLARAIQKPEVHRLLLGSYKGAYGLGVTRLPDDGDDAALLLRIEGIVPDEIPRMIEVEGEQVPVVVVGGFTAPMQL